MWLQLAGALGGAALGQAQRRAQLQQQEDSAKAAADAIRVSWAKQGQQNIPQIQWAQPGTMLGSTVQGALGGAMTGQNLAQQGFDWSSLFGGDKGGSGYSQGFGKSKPTALPY